MDNVELLMKFTDELKSKCEAIVKKSDPSTSTEASIDSMLSLAKSRAFIEFEMAINDLLVEYLEEV